ncbi:hypothetical protein SDC9_180005 [bioreactor metagenome]|uniref:Uncharacterized protein n=1 Tax=bioreactor metagenome TaxID=1076179 RepID=A0A645H220_9ZZZZ
MEKPSGWEYLLLGEILEQKINELEEIKSDLIYGFSFGNICKLSEPNDILDFISSKTEKMLQLIGNFNVLFKKAIPDALGAPGEAGDEEKLIYVGERFGSAYESLLRWGMEFKNLSVNEEWAGLINSVSKLWVSPVTDINEYVKKYKAGMIEMRLHLDKYLITDENMPAATIDLTLVLNSPDLSEFDTELEKIRRKM